MCQLFCYNLPLNIKRIVLYSKSCVLLMKMNVIYTKTIKKRRIST